MRWAIWWFWCVNCMRWLVFGESREMDKLYTISSAISRRSWKARFVAADFEESGE